MDIPQVVPGQGPAGIQLQGPGNPAARGSLHPVRRGRPRVSVFLREGDQVFHTYSAYERGLDVLLGTYRWLDLTPLGRQRHVTGFAYHDTYDQQS